MELKNEFVYGDDTARSGEPITFRRQNDANSGNRVFENNLVSPVRQESDSDDIQLD